jgi:hypothetical protein
LSRPSWDEYDLDAIKDKIRKSTRYDLGCWESKTYIMPNGYSRLNWGGKRYYIHRLSYIAFKGIDPGLLDVHHLCNNRCCANPAHLEAVTHQDNMVQGFGFAGMQSRQKVCIRGHELSKRKDGKRWCSECRKLKRRADRLGIVIGSPLREQFLKDPLVVEKMLEQSL